MLWRLFRTYLRPYRGQLAIVVFLQTLSTVATLYLPSINGDIIDRGVAVQDTHYVLVHGGLMLAVSALQIATAIVAVYVGARVAMAYGRDLRGAVFHHVGQLSAREVGKLGAPSLITRTTNDVQQIQMLLQMSVTMFVMAPIMCVGGLVMALREDLSLSRLLLVCIPVLAGCMGFIIARMVPKFRVMQPKIDTVNRVLREQITGMRVVRAFVREPAEDARFEEANADLTGVALAIGKLQAMMWPTVMLVFNASSVAVLWFGAQRVASGAIGVGALIAYLSYLMQILVAVMMTTFLSIIIPRAAVCAERIIEVLDTEPAVAPPAAPKTPAELTGVVELRNVDVRDREPEALWARIGVVPQRSFLFSGTIATNLRFGNPDATDDELWAALEIAQAKDFVSAMPEQLDAPIAQGGTNVSGGQRQRLAIARALLREPGVFLFDDSFSALDLATEARLRVALRPRTRAATVIVVAQRVASIRDADQILVLDAGRIVGRGTHAELVATCPTYAEIVTSQTEQQEVAA